ncbi:DASH complex subunit Ask1-domain-containing protein [Fomitopsis serialis]|uniref:DASH complex subunit Ask1-domain-containing protein n=1 Tax=Fomitopsis serialis TaxID=139415 RepID=UPI00200788CD|nr:DASH complex subunit Ask1-domain-containing protein [Neoantrodia serialis]KAH9936973.1 DASH complex subunit Ask1-domain-containing protein [Neoantrodia serialis]
MPPSLKPIDPLPERWEPPSDPNDIVVPGLDANAPVYDQIEQIEQLITMKLQNIDANFSKMQHIMASKILPAVKRYAVGTEPVREAARFWTTFFEQAAQIRVPTYEEYSSVNEQEETEPSSDVVGTSTEEPEATPTRSHHSTYTSEGSSEDSFMPQAAMSSTPATAFQSFGDGQSDPTPSWTTLAGEVQSLGQDDEVSGVSERTARYEESEDVTQRAIPPPRFLPEHPDHGSSSTAKGKSREMPPPLLQGVLRRNVTLTDGTSPRKPGFSPLKVKPKTPVAKTRNPYLPPGSKPTDWKGVVDLADPSTATPRKALLFVGRYCTPTRGPFDHSAPCRRRLARQAAERIFQGLLNVENRGVFAAPAATRAAGKTNGVESSGSSMPTPPSLSRYQPDPQSSTTGSSLVDAIGILSDSGTGGAQSSEQPPVRARAPDGSQISSAPSRPPTFTAPQPPPPPAPQTPPPPQYDLRHIRDDDLDGEMDNAFLFASQGGGNYDEDDSFASDETDDFADDDGGEGGPAIEVYAAEGDSFDDSFDNEFDGTPEEETVFGVPPAQRLRMQARDSESNLRMYGADLLQDTLGVGSQMAQAGRVEDTPTPFVAPINPDDSL